MPTAFVGVHLPLVAISALFGLWFLTFPCYDLCLQWIGVLAGLAVAGIGLAGLVIWKVWRRASPLLLWDSVLTGGSWTLLSALSVGSDPIAPYWLRAVLVIGIFATLAAGRAVASHRIERLIAIAALLAVPLVEGVGTVPATIVGIAALGVGWLFSRGSQRAAPAGPTTPPAAAG